MIRLFQNRNTVKGFAYIDAWINMYLKEVSIDNDDELRGVLKLIFFLKNNEDISKRDYPLFLRDYFGTHRDSGLVGRSMFQMVLQNNKEAVAEILINTPFSESDKKLLIKTADMLCDGQWTEDKFESGLKFLLWNAGQQEDLRDRRFMLANLRYVKDKILEYKGEIDPDRIPSNIFYLFRFPKMQIESLETFVTVRYGEFNGSLRGERDKDALAWFIDQAREVFKEYQNGSEEAPFFRLLCNLREDIEYDHEYFETLAEPVIEWLLEELPFAYFSWFSNEDEKQPWQDGEYLSSMELLREMHTNLFKAPDVEPSRLYAYLNRFVIGQNRAKKILSTAIYGHMKRIKHKREKFLPDAVLLVGPSGSGKTELVRHLIDATMLPAAIIDVSGMNGSQYSGGLHREHLLIELLNKANGDLEKAQNGILFMDEFDKLLIPSYDKNGIDTHDEVQSQLLTVIEGSEIPITFRGEKVLFDTSRLLFILAGAFQGIEENIREDSDKKMKTSGSIGFDASLKKDSQVKMDSKSVTTDVLISFGMKRELAGRIGSVAVLDGLLREDLKRILTQPKNSILERFQDEFNALCGGELVLEDDVIERIVDKAMSYKVGARGLSIALRKMLSPVMYEAPDHRDCRCAKLSLKGGEIYAEWISSFKEAML